MQGKPIILFDGVCNLCNGSVDFIIRRDRCGIFRFASLQSAAGRALLQQHGLPPDTLDSVVLVDEAGVHARSTAALRIARKLGAAWPLAYAFIVVPRPLRDALYDFIAHRRYRWFGKRETCRLPSPAERDRFLDA
jgi:predicted DCC family thiol-disulfide oxidoreductase YuxK